MAVLLKLLLHRHLASVSVQTLWRFAKGIGVAFVALWVIPDCIPLLDEITVSWLAVSVLWELNSRGEIDAKWLPEVVRKRLGKGRENVIDVKTDETK